MANMQRCIDYALHNEDSLGLHLTVPDLPGRWQQVAGGRFWVGAHAISGINSAAFPEWYARLSALSPDKRGPLVDSFYQTEEWNEWFGDFHSDLLAERVFDMAVNSGPYPAVLVAQKAAKSLGSHLIVDGHFGTVTINAVNRWDEIPIVNAFRQFHVEYLRKECSKNPALPQLIARALQ